MFFADFLFVCFVLFLLLTFLQEEDLFFIFADGYEDDYDAYEYLHIIFCYKFPCRFETT